MSAPALAREVIVFPKDQIEELKHCCQAVSACQDGGIDYLLLEGLALPPGCSPARIDALLCPTFRDGYSSRLFFAAQVQSPFARNWNFDGRICERNWHGYSWKTDDPRPMRLAQLVRLHLDGLRRA
jgi:hypothetical protein